MLELKKVLDDQGRPQEVPLVTAARPFPSQLTFTGWPAHLAHFAGTLFNSVLVIVIVMVIIVVIVMVMVMVIVIAIVIVIVIVVIIVMESVRRSVKSGFQEHFNSETEASMTNWRVPTGTADQLTF